MAVVNVFSAFSGPCGVNGWLLLQRAVSPSEGRESLHQLFDQLMLNILLLLRVQRTCCCVISKMLLAESCITKMRRITLLQSAYNVITFPTLIERVK